MKIIKKKRNNATIAAMIGTALEYYDMSLYGFMAPILVSIFLPTFDKLNALLLTFIFTPISIIVRPIGAIVIGKIGDKYGRKNGLTISIGGMAIVTGMIGLLPTYHQIGFLAPILFILFRTAQGFFLAGEYNGGAIFILEHSEKNKGFLSGVYTMYTVVGILCATAIATIISYLPVEYWRIPYLLGFVTGIVGLYIRKHVKESPKFLKYKQIEDAPTKTITNKYPNIILLIGVTSFYSALCVLPTILMNSLLPLATSFSLPTIMSVNSFATVLSMLCYPLFGYVADKLTFNKSMKISAIIILLSSYPLISLISYDKLEYIIFMKLCFAVMTAWFVAPFHAWAQSLFHTKERYMAISFSYAIGYQLGGFMVPVSLWVWKYTNSLAPVYLLLIFWSLIALVTLHFERKLEKHD